jgi:hypothetical protein
MTLDLSSITPSARATYIRLGRHHTSADTLAQAEQTLSALAKYADEVADVGFIDADVKQLAAAREALQAAGVGRDETVTKKKTSRTTFHAAMRAAKDARLTANTVLDNVKRALFPLGDDASLEATKKIDSTVEVTSKAGADPMALAGQLDLLGKLFADATIQKAAKARGGKDVQTSLADCASALRDAAKAIAGAPGTPGATDDVDLIDGLIVTIVRSARKSGRAAAKKLGKPAIAIEFELTKLYAHRPTAAAAATSPGTDGAGHGLPVPAPAAPKSPS